MSTIDPTVSAADNLGPHLLRRIPSAPDERNWPLSAFMRDDGQTPTSIEVLNAAVQKSWEGRATKRWIAAATPLLAALVPPAPAPGPQPQPTPQPGPTTTAVEWLDAHQVDQGQTGHCVGEGWVTWANVRGSENVDDAYTSQDGHDLYYETVALAGRPNDENGATGHEGARAMVARGRIKAYAWAANVDELAQWILTRGPIGIGTDWYTGMFSPDPTTGIIKPTGQVEGGHWYTGVGYDPTTGLFKLQNSWGDAWGLNGYCFISRSDLAAVYENQGEGCTGVELPLAA